MCRHLVVLACRVSLREGLDPERAPLLRAHVRDAGAARAARHGGVVAQQLAEGFIALFNFPRAAQARPRCWL